MQHLVIIPTYNESGNIISLIDRILTITYCDILIIDDGSSDGTLTLVQEKILQSGVDGRLNLINRESKLGVGSAHKVGLAWAKSKEYDIATTMDGDWTHDPKYINDLTHNLIELKSDVVIGSRFMNKESLSEWTIWRRSVSRAVRILTKFSLGLNFDNSSGFRSHLISSQLEMALSKVKAENYDYFFESLISFKRHNLTITECDIKLMPRLEGSSKLTLGLAISALRNLIRLTWKIRTKRD